MKTREYYLWNISQEWNNIFTKKAGCDTEYIQVGKTMEEQRVFYTQIIMNLSK